MITVVGSGPAGVSAASALVSRRQRVRILDGGVELAPQRRALVASLASATPAAWSRETVAMLRGQTRVGLGGVPEKLVHGSDHPYRDVERWIPFRTTRCDTRPTLARGGFSTVWGSCALPYLEEDLADWPIALADLAPHYAAVRTFLPLSAHRDALADRLPLFGGEDAGMPSSRQATALLADMEASRARLERAGFQFGRSRIAVRGSASAVDAGCRACASCMYGCPYGLIYDASDTLDRLLATGRVEYRGGVVVERFDERGDHVELRLRDMRTGAVETERCERLYVACGPIATTRLALASLELFDRRVEIKDSQYFLLPWLRASGVPKVRDEALHTLCQLFLELRDDAIDPRNVHLQIYSYNDLYAALFDGLLGPLARPAAPLVDALLSRMLLIQGYLHSDSSPSIEATLRRDGATGVLELVGRPNSRTRATIRRLMLRLARLAPAFRALPLAPGLRVAAPGRGYHSGGSFPMRAPGDEREGEFATDVLGRLAGLARVHLVDASVFPTIPSTTITYSAMANAHRIASAEI